MSGRLGENLLIGFAAGFIGAGLRKAWSQPARRVEPTVERNPEPGVSGSLWDKLQKKPEYPRE